MGGLRFISFSTVDHFFTSDRSEKNSVAWPFFVGFGLGPLPDKDACHSQGPTCVDRSRLSSQRLHARQVPYTLVFRHPVSGVVPEEAI